MAPSFTMVWFFVLLTPLLRNFGRTFAVPTECTIACEWPLQQQRIVYERNELLDLRGSSAAIAPDIPEDLRKRKRRKKGGIRARLRRHRFNPPLPSILTGNAQSLSNKLDELSANVKYLNE